MATTRNFIKAHPVLTYYVLTFILSWGCILMAIGPDGILGRKEVSEDLLPILYAAALVGPSAAGIVMTGIVDGKAGFRDLRSRLLRWRVGARWYLVAILTVPLSLAAVLLPLSLVSPAFLPAIITNSDKLSLVLMGIVVGLLVGVFEELGWTGFALPHLR